MIFGAAVRLNPHVLSRNEQGEMDWSSPRLSSETGRWWEAIPFSTAGSELAARRMHARLPGLSAVQPLGAGKATRQGSARAMIWDLHVHVAGVGSQGSGNYLSPAFRRSLACRLFMRQLGLSARALNEPDCDRRIARFIVDQLNASGVDRAVLLAFDAAYRDDGTRDERSNTLMVADNDFVADLASSQEKVSSARAFTPTAATHWRNWNGSSRVAPAWSSGCPARRTSGRTIPAAFRFTTLLASTKSHCSATPAANTR